MSDPTALAAEFAADKTPPEPLTLEKAEWIVEKLKGFCREDSHTTTLHVGYGRAALMVLASREAALAAAEERWRDTQKEFVAVVRTLDEWRPDGYPPPGNPASTARWIIETLEREHAAKLEAVEGKLRAHEGPRP